MARVARVEASTTRAVIDRALAEYGKTYVDARWQTYLAVHHERYQFLLTEVVRLVASLARTNPRILVIGPRFEVGLLQQLVPEAAIDTLGINPGLIDLREGERFFEFNLANADLVDTRPDVGPHELIVMAEVLEHVPMPPGSFLPWLRSILTPGGYLLIQTPNAVAAQNRLRMLIGKNPFQALADDRAYPGHFREYTVEELAREGRRAGLRVAKITTANYFLSEKASNRLFHRVQRAVPRTLRAGITITYQSPAGSA